VTPGPRATAVSPAPLRSNAKISFPTTIGQDCGGLAPFVGEMIGTAAGAGSRFQGSCLFAGDEKKLAAAHRARRPAPPLLVQSPCAHSLAHLPVPWQNPWAFLRPTDISSNKTEHIVSPTHYPAVFVRTSCCPPAPRDARVPTRVPAEQLHA